MSRPVGGGVRVMQKTSFRVYVGAVAALAVGSLALLDWMSLAALP